MNTRHLVASTILSAMVLGFNPVQAAVSTDFAGRYDLEYTRVQTDLQVTIDLPNKDPITIPVAVDEALINEQLSVNAIEPLLEKAANALVQAGVPEALQPIVMKYIEQGLLKTVDVINEQALQLPDEMSLTVTSSRLGTVTGLFSDIDVQGTQPFTLPGTIWVTDPLAAVELLPIFSGSIDASKAFTGVGDYEVYGLEVSETVKGVQISVSGDLSMDMNLEKIGSVREP